MSEQTTINPNENVVNEEKAIGGSGGVSFDDLEKVMDEEAAAPKKTKAPAPKRESQKEPEGEEGDEEGNEEGDEEGNEEGDAEPVKAASRDPEVKGKKVKGTLGGEPIDIHTGAMIPVKIDGELVPVAIQTLVNNFSGKQAWDKKFTELDNERQDFVGRVRGLDSFVQGIFDKAEEIETSEDPVATSFEVLKMIGQLAGRDPRSMMEKINSGLSSDYDQVSGLSEIEKENWHLKRRLKIDSLDKDLDTKLSQKATANAEKASSENRILAQYGISDSERDELTSYLKANKLGTSIKEVVELKVISSVTNAVQSFDKSLLGDKELLDLLIDKSIKDPNFTTEDVMEVLTSVYSSEEQAGDEGDESEKRLSRKLGKTGQATKKKTPTEPKTKRVTKSDDFWDSIS